MSPRARRLATALLAVAAALFAGRWLVTFLAERWWAETVSAGASLYLTRRQLVGLGLDVLATAIAALWFTVHARFAVRVLAGLPEREAGGHPAFRALLRRPDAQAWGLAAALLLGLLTGAGVSRWTDAVMLAWVGARFDVVEPGLGLDVGVLATGLPFWLRLQTFCMLLVLVALSLTGLLYFLGGAVRLARKPRITEAARIHLGVLLAFLALVLAGSQVMRPYELAAGLPHVVTAGVVHLHRAVSFVLAGLCLVGTVLSLLWAVRPWHGLVAATWLLLSGVLVGAYQLLPDNPPAPGDTDAALTRRELEVLAYGLPSGDAAPARHPVRYALWDLSVLSSARTEIAGTGPPRRGILPGTAGNLSVWVLVARGSRPDLVSITAILDGSVDTAGAPITVTSAVLSPEAGPPAVPVELAPQTVRPGALQREMGQGPGVRFGGVARRAALAWALQAPALLGEGADRRLAWHLTPTERLRHAAPFAVWGLSRAVVEGARLVWLLDGYVTAEAFPQARRRLWRGREVAYARAAFLGLADAADGTVRIFLRPGADPLALAWARIAAPLVQDADRVPASILELLDYPQELLPLQADLLVEDTSRWPPRDTLGGRLEVAEAGRPIPGTHPGQWVLPVVNRTTDRTEALLVGERVGGRDLLFLARTDSFAPASPEALKRTWHRFPFLEQLQDSILQAGGRWEVGAVRYVLPPPGDVEVYVPFYALDPSGRPRIAAIGVGRGARLGVGRTVREAEENLRGETAGLVRLWDVAAVLDAARRWARTADSALRQGDLAEFGRAFAALLSLLEGEPPK